MDGQIPVKVRESRKNELYEIQQEVVFSQNESLIGNVEEILIEGALTDDPGFMPGGLTAMLRRWMALCLYRVMNSCRAETWYRSG